MWRLLKSLHIPCHHFDLTEGMKLLHLSLFLLLLISCTNEVQNKAILLDRQLTLTPILSASFDSLLQEVRQLPPHRQVASLLLVAGQKEKETGGLIKQEKLLLEALSLATPKEKKKILVHLVNLYHQLDLSGFPDADIKGIRRSEELEEHYSLSEGERWEIKKGKALLLNCRGLQEQYLPLWFELLAEHRAADEPVLVIEDLCTIANHFVMLNDRERGLSLYKEAYQLSTEKQLPQSQKRCFNGYINLLYDLDRYAEVVNYYHEIGVDSAASLIPSAYSMLSICYLRIHKPDSARRYLAKMWKAPQEGNKITINCRIAESYCADNQEDSASVYLNKALALFEKQVVSFREKNIKAELPGCFLPTCSAFADLLHRSGKVQKANESFALVEPLMNETTKDPTLWELQIDALNKFSTHCRSIRQYEKALDLLAHRDSLQHIYKDYKEARDSQNLTDRFQIQELLHTIDLKNVQLSYSQRINLMITSAVLILLSLLAAFLYWHRLRKKQLHAQFKELLKYKDALEKEKEMEAGIEMETELNKEEGASENGRLPAKTKQLYQAAEKEVTSQQLFRNHDITLEWLAKELRTNRVDLSTSINACAKCNFSQWINSYRIQYLLKHFQSMQNLEKLWSEAGFKSQSAFRAFFKECTGLSPKEYLAMHTPAQASIPRRKKKVEGVPLPPEE